MALLALVLATLALISSGAGSASARTGSLGRFRLHPCHSTAHLECGSLVVPAYWSRPEQQQALTVRFEILRHSDLSAPQAQPIVAMEGGPGLPSIASLYSYSRMLAPLLAYHDLLVVDQRGTGTSSGIDCPALQRNAGLEAPSGFAQAAGACAAQLGELAGAFGSAAAADDLAAILDHLQVPSIDLYGDSYGSYAAQVFTLHHAGLVHALVLDGTYDNAFDPLEREASAALRNAWTRLCERSSCPEPSILAALAAFSAKLQGHPIVVDVKGGGHLTLTASSFAQLVEDATYTYTVFRDLPAAMLAAGEGDRAPIERLVREDAASNETASYRGYSVGDLEAVSCNDYPALWNLDSPPSLRGEELSSALGTLAPDAFAPFPNSVWLDSLDANQLVTGCELWPKPAVADPPFPAQGALPDTPVLILDGEYDQATPVADAEHVAGAWPRSTFVEVANSGHVTGFADSLDCTSRLIQHFMSTATAGDSSCAGTIAPVWVVPRFPVRLSDAPSVTAPGASAGQAGWVAAVAVGDALARWWNEAIAGRGRGLYGGTFTVGPDRSETAPLRFRFDATRFVTDLAISGSAIWDRSTQQLGAEVTVRGPGGVAGRFRLRWSTRTAGASALVTGRYGATELAGRMPAPWSASP